MGALLCTTSCGQMMAHLPLAPTQTPSHFARVLRDILYKMIITYSVSGRKFAFSKHPNNNPSFARPSCQFISFFYWLLTHSII